MKVRFMWVLALLALAVGNINALAAFSSPTNILAGTTEAFDMSSSIGLSILAFLMVVGVVVAGFRVRSGRGK